MPVVNIIAQVSQEVLDLYNKNLITLGPGGFKNLSSGRMVQLLKPIAMSGGSSVSELLSGVQTGMQAVNLGVSIKNGIKLDRVLKTMMVLKNIAWSGTAIGAVNLALNAAGLATLSRKIDGVNKRLDQIASEIKQEMRNIQTEGMIQSTRKLIDNLISVADILEKNDLNRNDNIAIQEYLNTAKNDINWWAEKYKQSSNEESSAIFTLLYDLSAMYAAVLKEYGAQYYYCNGSYPGNYNNWIRAFDYVDDKDLQKRLKRTIWLANPIATSEKLADAFDFTLNSIRLQAQDIAEYKEIVPYLPKEAHDDFDAYIRDKIEKGEVEIVDEAETEDPREAVLLQQNGYSAA